LELGQRIHSILLSNNLTAGIQTLLYNLAIVDRLQASIDLADLSNRCDETFQNDICGPWRSASILARESAICLFHATNVFTSNDSVLAGDWTTASDLCDAAGKQCSLLKCPGIAVLDRQHHLRKQDRRIQVCKQIIDLLSNFSEVVPGQTHRALAVYKFKKGVAENLAALDKLAEKCQAGAAAVVHAHATLRDAGTAFKAATLGVYAVPYEHL
jgi:hypothetical protein